MIASKPQTTKAVQKPDYTGEQYLHLLREALASISDLTIDAAQQREATIAQSLESAQRIAQREWQEQTGDARATYDRLAAAAEADYAALRGEIDARHAGNLAELEQNLKNARRTVLSAFKETVGEAHLDREERHLLANTVAPATIKGFLRDLRRREQELEGLESRRCALETHAAAAMARYRIAAPESPVSKDPVGGSAAELFAACEAAVGRFEKLGLPGFMSGATPFVVGAILLTLFTAGAAMLPRMGAQVTMAVAAAAGAGFGLVILAFFGQRLRAIARRQAQAAAKDVISLLGDSRRAIAGELQVARERFAAAEAEANAHRDRELLDADATFERISTQATQIRDAAAQKLAEEFAAKQATLVAKNAKRIRLAESRRDEALAEARAALAQATAGADALQAGQIGDARSHESSARRQLEAAWDRGAAALAKAVAQIGALQLPAFDWHAPEGMQSWSAARGFVANVPFGQLELNLDSLSPGVRARSAFPPFRNGLLRFPAILALPTRGSLLIEAAREARADAIELLRAVIVRILTTLPAGQAHFTIIDPVGLGENFSGLMHLADYQDALIGGRIWSEREHIESRLSDLTAHMETVIQKYLRNEFDTIAAYNAQAGELAEPYRFLVIADYPAALSDVALERLLSIVRSGARCGVFTLIVADGRTRVVDMPNWDDLREHSVHLVNHGDGFRFADPLLRPYRLEVDRPPTEARLTEIMHIVGREAKANLRVEVPFESIAPRPEEFWSGDASNELRVPIGRSGAARLQYFRLGHGLAQHALIAGKTGSGKSTLLHVLVTNLALRYRPGEVEFYLVDFKKGVEFKTYVTHALPHARAIAIESDREFGLSVLQRIDAEMHRRGELYRAAGVQDMAGYRRATGEVLPRTLLIVDEFQVFFGEDDRLAQEAGILLDRLVRQGRAFGIHVLLGSQTLAGNIALARSTLGQMAIRIALQCAEADAQLIMDDSNTAARLLVRPGEAIYNDAGGLVQGNNPFQTSWLSDEQRSTYLQKVAALAQRENASSPHTVVFEGNVPADIRGNPLLASILRDGPSTAPLRAWLGEPVAIKEPTCATLLRQPGANLLILGQQDRPATAVMSAAALSLLVQRTPGGVRIILLDGTPDDRREESGLFRLARQFPGSIDSVAYRDAAQRVLELAELVQGRLDGSASDDVTYLLVIHGLQRYRALRRSEDDYSYSSEAAPAKARPDQALALILREGPSVGVHVLTWCDTLANLERSLERSALREFDNRLLFQMSATDSSHLIDSPEANNLGLHRALLFSEERGVIEKLRPYDVMTDEWLAEVAARHGRA